jgi:hypothetical protein
MSPEALFLTLAGSMQAVVLALYVVVLLFLSRRWGHAIAKHARKIAMLRRSRSRATIVQAIDSSFAILLRLTAGAYAAPLLVLVVPLLLGIGCLEVTAHLVRIGP